MKKEQLGQLIIASEDTLYHVAKTLLYNDADCADAIQEAIVKYTHSAGRFPCKNLAGENTDQ